MQSEYCWQAPLQEKNGSELIKLKTDDTPDVFSGVFYAEVLGRVCVRL